MEGHISKEEIKSLILKNGLMITDVIDAVIEINGIIGVGLISLGSELSEYCYRKGQADKVYNHILEYSSKQRCDNNKSNDDRTCK